MDVREKLAELLNDIQVRGEDFTDYEIYGMRVPDTYYKPCVPNNKADQRRNKPFVHKKGKVKK